jgi:diadenylate cyclase
MANFLNNILFIFQRLDWLSVLDILLVTLIFFVVLYSLRDTQAMILLRGMIFLVIALVLLTTVVELPAFSWLVQARYPCCSPSRLSLRRRSARTGTAGRAGTTIVQSSIRHGRKYGKGHPRWWSGRDSPLASTGLIVIQRRTAEQYIETGVQMRADVTPNCFCRSSIPIRSDEAVIVRRDDRRAACVMPLSAAEFQSFPRTPNGPPSPRRAGHLGGQ